MWLSSKKITLLLSITVSGCVTHLPENPLVKPNDNVCPGTAQVAGEFANSLEEAEDQLLLNKAVGKPNEGALCQGKVYRSRENTTAALYRLWNSTNKNSKLGQWWAQTAPQGKIAQFRKDYEVCYQWTPLDKLTKCTIKPGSLMVIGTGQSVQCSPFLSYPASPIQQVFIENPGAALVDCVDYDITFGWE